MNKLNKKGESNIGMFVMMFIVVILGVALFVPTMDTANQMTSKQVETNQSQSLVTAYLNESTVLETVNYTIRTQSDWKQLECPLTAVTIRNGPGTDLVEDTDYVLYDEYGIFSLLNTSLTYPTVAVNDSYVDYTYCADGYNTNSGARSIIAIVLIFFALAIFAGMFPWVRETLGDLLNF